MSSDHLVASGMLPARRDLDGPFAWWQQMRPRFFDGFHRRAAGWFSGTPGRGQAFSGQRRVGRGEW